MSGWIEQVVTEFGYLGLALLTLLENVFPPLPSEVILPLGGYLAQQGRLAIVGVVLAGTVGSVLGGLVLYWLGSRFDRERLVAWAGRHGGWLLLTREDIEQAFDWFERHGTKAVFLARLVPGVRSLISIPAGTCGMQIAPFLFYTTLGTALWSALLATAGMILGAQYQQVGRVLQWATYALVALVLLSIVRWIVKRRSETN